MKKLFTLAIGLLSFLMISAQTGFIQTDWSGGQGQEYFSDPTMHLAHYSLDVTSSPGNLIPDEAFPYKSITLHMAEYNGKLFIGYSFGILMYNPQNGEYSMSLPGMSLYENTIYEGKLYSIHGYNVLCYDGSTNDYGLGPNGWKIHSNLAEYGMTSLYTIENVDGELLIGCRSGYSGRAMYWNGSQWIQKGNTFSNGIYCFIKYNGVLYAGTHWWGHIYRWTGSSWVIAFSTGMMSVKDFEIYNGELYAASLNTNYNGGKIHRFNGSLWTQVYGGYGVHRLAVQGDNLIFAVQRSSTSAYNNLPGQVYHYNPVQGTQLLNTFDSESFAFDLEVMNGDLYYGGYGGIPTAKFYKNNTLFDYIHGLALVSSKITKTWPQWGNIQYDAINTGRGGFSVCLREVNGDTYGLPVYYGNNSPVNVSSNTIQYILYGWNIGLQPQSEFNEIRIGDVQSSPLEIAAEFDPIECPGSTTLVEITATGGTPPYEGVGTFEKPEGYHQFTVSDAAGQTETIEITILQSDLIPPQAIAQNINLPLNADGIAMLSPEMLDAGSSDNCGIISMSVSPSEFNCLNTGVNPVIFTVTDASGNTSSTEALVTISDILSPTVITQNVNIYLDENGLATMDATMVDAGSFDNCGISSLLVSPSNFNCENRGENVVILTVSDENGNTASGQAVVNVVDAVPPIVLTNNVALTLDNNGQAFITSSMIDAGSSDNCGIMSMLVSPSAFECSNLGDNTVELIVTDVSGNVSSASAIVQVSAPELFASAATDVPLVYFGYNPMACANLTASASGGVEPYSFVWNNAASGNTMQVCPQSPQWYTVSVSDNCGSTVTSEVFIDVMDVRCGKKMDKVLVCKVPPGNPANAHTICISPNAVAAQLATGSYLGDCGTMKTKVRLSTDEISMHVFPNPFRDQLNCEFELIKDGSVEIDLVNLNGSIVQNVYKGQLQSNQIQTVIIQTSSLQKGMYFLRQRTHDKIIMRKVVRIF